MRNTAVRTLLVLWAFVVSQATEVKDDTKSVAFSCRGRSPGYYADLDTGCQDYHMCDAGGRRYTYSCPNQTRFQQRVMICDHWFMVNCSLSETHYGANLLIGQKDRQFVEHFQQSSGHNEERSYPSRSRAFYAGPSSASSEDGRTQPQGANEIKQALFGKHSSAQSVTKKLPEEKDSKTPNNRYYSQFSTPTGSIKPTTERSLTREFTNNPFFRSLTQAPASLADKGDRGSLTFLSPHQSDGVSTSRSPRTTASPLPSRRTTSSFSTPPVREATPNLRNAPTFANYQQQRRTSTLVTTTVPLTYDYGFVTPEGHSNHLTQTETPNLRNNFSKVLPGDFTSEPSLTTRYESLKTRERNDVRAPPTPVASAPHDSGVTPSPQAALNATQGGRPQPTSHGSGNSRPDVTQGAGGLQKTPGGFRFTTVNAAQVPDGRQTSFSPLVPILPEKTVSGAGRLPYGSGAVPTGIGAVLSGNGIVPTRSEGVFTGGGAVAALSGRNPSGPSVNFSGSRLVPTGSGGGLTGSGAVPNASGAVPSGSGAVSSGSGVVPTGSGAVATVSGRSPSGSSVTFSGNGGVPPSPGVTIPVGGFPSGPGEALSSNGGASTGLGATLVSGKDDLPSVFDAVPPSSTGEEEDDYNTVEVRIPDPRRMFFIPDSAAREAEMLSSNNETVFKISLPSSRPHGAMRFKGVRGAEGRRADCPQCHPAFLLPGKCQPCVLIRR